MDSEYNATLIHFLAKGLQARDAVKATRTPNKTRPIGLRNTDNKIVNAATVWSLRRPFLAHISHAQRGGKPEGNFV